MPKKKSCASSVTHVTCGTTKFVSENLVHYPCALKMMLFPGTVFLALQ